MLVLEQLFTDMAELRSTVPGLESNLTFTDLNASALTARKRVTDLIGRTLYDSIVTDYQTKAEQYDALRMAVANFIARQHLVFDTIARRKDDIDVYKYELEEMERAYMDNYYNSMDTLMRLLCEEGSTGWKSSRLARMLEGLPIADASRFDELYPIDLSYLFYFRTVPLQREIFDTNLAGLYAKAARILDADDSESQTILARLDRVTAKWTVSLAMRRFDIIEFPAVIRNLFSDSKAVRNGQNVQQRLLQMADDLSAECRSEIESLQMLLDSDTQTDISTRTSFNRADDLIIVMP